MSKIDKDNLLTFLNKREVNAILENKKLHKIFKDVDPLVDVISTKYEICQIQNLGYIVVKEVAINGKVVIVSDISEIFFQESGARNFCLDVSKALLRPIKVVPKEEMRFYISPAR